MEALKASLHERVLERARKKAEALDRTLNQLVREYPERLAGGDDPEKEVAELSRLPGDGDPQVR